MADDDERRLWLPPSARTEDMRVNFNAVQRQLLARLGVDAEQLKRLEPALSIIKLYTAAPAALNDVRKNLSALLSAVSKSSSLLNSLLQVPPYEEARCEARDRLVSAWFRISPNIATTEKPLAAEYEQLARLREIAEHALREIPRSQSRRMSPIYPIEYIDTALLCGFRTTHREAKRMPPYPFFPAASESSKFRAVADVCYEAAGAPSGNPERAIKAYIRINGRKARQQRILTCGAEIKAVKP